MLRGTPLFSFVATFTGLPWKVNGVGNGGESGVSIRFFRAEILASGHSFGENLLLEIRKKTVLKS